MSLLEPSTHLYLIRHGETDSNAFGILHGITDVPLNEIGRTQAVQTGWRLSRELTIHHVYSSPLRRARQTASAYAEMCSTSPKIHRGFTEMSFGEAEGTLFDDLAQRFPAESSRFLDVHDMDVKFPGGESRGEFFFRIHNAVTDVVERHRGECVAIFSHGGVVAAAIRTLLRSTDPALEHANILNCSVTHFEITQSGTVSHRVNDADHLRCTNQSFTLGEDS